MLYRGKMVRLLSNFLNCSFEETCRATCLTTGHLPFQFVDVLFTSYFSYFFPLFLYLMQLMARRPIPVLREQGFLSSYRHSDRFFSLQTISSQSVAVAEQTVSSQRVAVAEQAVSSQCCRC